MTAYTEVQAATCDEDRFTSPGGKWVHRQELKQVFAAADLVGPLSHPVLEVGCGTGRLMAPLVRAGFTVHGTDASLHMLYKNQHHDALLSHARAHRLPYDSCRFAMTYAIRLFSNFKTDVYAASVLLEMARVTREGGYILVGRMNSYRPKTTKIAIPRCFDGLKLVKRDSAMMFGIPMHVSCSEGLHPPLVFLDSIATRLLPRLANQQYYLYRKDYSHA